MYCRFKSCHGYSKYFIKVINMKLKSIQDILDMLDLFYANKHYHDRLERQYEKREQENLARVTKR